MKTLQYYMTIARNSRKKELKNLLQAAKNDKIFKIHV